MFCELSTAGRQLNINFINNHNDFNMTNLKHLFRSPFLNCSFPTICEVMSLLKSKSLTLQPLHLTISNSYHICPKPLNPTPPNSNPQPHVGVSHHFPLQALDTVILLSFGSLKATYTLNPKTLGLGFRVNLKPYSL